MPHTTGCASPRGGRPRYSRRPRRPGDASIHARPRDVRVMIQLGAESSGSSAGGGSRSRTSSAAPAISPDRRARFSAAWSTIGPRAMLTIKAVRSSAREFLADDARDSGLSGRWTQTKSDRSASPSSPTRSQTPSYSTPSRPSAMMRIPNARATGRPRSRLRPSHDAEHLPLELERGPGAHRVNFRTTPPCRRVRAAS